MALAKSISKKISRATPIFITKLGSTWIIRQSITAARKFTVVVCQLTVTARKCWAIERMLSHSTQLRYIYLQEPPLVAINPCSDGLGDSSCTHEVVSFLLDRTHSSNTKQFLEEVED